jgi:integrase
VSVKRRADTKQWEVRWRENGRNRSRSFASKGDANAFEVEVQRRKRLGTLALLTAGDQTLAEFVEEWWRLYAIQSLAENTRQTYGYVWDRHVRGRLGGYRLRDLTTRELQAFRAELGDASVGEPTILKALTMLQAVFRTAVQWGVVAINPVQGVSKPSQRPKRRVDPLPPRTVEQLLQALAEHGAISRALASVLAYAGLRPGEALALRWTHVRERTLWIDSAIALGSEKDTKTGRSRSVKLLRPLADDLGAYRQLAAASPLGLVFPSSARDHWQDHDWRNWRRRVFQPAAAAIGLIGARPYDLRHSFVSLLIHEGLSIVDVAAQAGHSPQTCLTRYAHVFAEFDATDRRPAEAVITEARAAAEVREVYAASGAAA